MNFLQKKYKVDYHIHTTNSDGSLPVSRLLQIAQKEKVKEISFTDHDSIGAYDELAKMDWHKIYSGKIYNGVELSVAIDGFRTELLGYNFDIKKMKKFKYIQPKFRAKNFEHLMKVLIKKAKALGFKTDKKIPINRHYPLVAKSFLDNVSRFPENKELIKEYQLNHRLFKRMLSDETFAFYVYPEIALPTMEEAANAIRKCGGFCILPHPFKDEKQGKFTPIEFIKYVNSLGLIDGVEVAHSSCSEDRTEKLLQLCKDNNLKISFGSDFHGGFVFDGKKVTIGTLMTGYTSLKMQEAISKLK